MILSSPILLSIIIFLPLLGAFSILLIRGEYKIVERNVKNVALWTSIITFILSLFLWINFDADLPGFQYVTKINWISAFGIQYYIGIDGISLFFVILSTFLLPICIISSWSVIKNHVKEYFIAFLLLEVMMVGMFCALDTILFYLFFEAVLIPMFIIIGVWGGPRRVYSAFKFFLYTLLGSVLMLLAVIALYVYGETTSIPDLMLQNFSKELQITLWLAFFASFAVKVPMWPVHTWLPDAHVEAPTAGSVILAGVLLKMGGYGLLRFSLPLFPMASEYFTPMIFILSVIAIIYTSLVALVQEDMKKLIAYSSVAHMGFVTLGIFTLTQEGLSGAIIQMLSHGLVSAALFLCVGVIYDRIHTREISRYGGLANRMPKYAFVFMLFTLASVGLPGLSGFIGEFLILIGAFQVNTMIATLAATGLILGAAYGLWLYRKIMFGQIIHDELKNILDLSKREVLLFASMIPIIIWMGIHPSSFTKIIEPSIHNLILQYNEKLEYQKKVLVPQDKRTDSVRK